MSQLCPPHSPHSKRSIEVMPEPMLDTKCIKCPMMWFFSSTSETYFHVRLTEQDFSNLLYRYQESISSQFSYTSLRDLNSGCSRDHGPTTAEGCPMMRAEIWKDIKGETQKSIETFSHKIFSPLELIDLKVGPEKSLIYLPEDKTTSPKNFCSTDLKTKEPWNWIE